jgi:hypothetical protein
LLQIFIPMLNNAHWIVYCINKVHKQIEILDPQNWEQKDDKNRHHTTISAQIRGRLNNAFQLFARSSFPNILNWTFPYINVPTQNPKTIVHSSACFILRTTTSEIGKWTRLADTSFSVIFFLVHFFNNALFSQPFIYVSHSPFVVHFLIMHHFLLLCVWSGSSIWVPGIVLALLLVPQVEPGSMPIP